MYGEPLPHGRSSFESADGLFRVVIDTVELDCYVEADPDLNAETLNGYLAAHVYAHGYELIDEDECEPDVTAEGWTRIYLAAPIKTVKVVDLSRRASMTRHLGNGTLAGLGAAIMATAIFTHLSPVLEVFN